MDGFYEEMQGVAGELLAEFAQGVVTVTVPGTTTPGPNPWDPPVVTDPVTYPLDATVKGVSKEFVDGTTILATDLEVTAAVFGAEAGPADAVSIDGTAMTLLKVIRVPAAGTVVAWKWIVRG